MQRSTSKGAFADIIENGNKIIECKSWTLNGISFQHFVAGTSGSVDQFITYLSDQQRVTSLQQIEYWFDKNKLNGSTDAAPIKQKFKQMMLDNGVLTQRGEEVFNAIWGNTRLRESLFLRIADESEARDKFEEFVENLSSSIYNFIKVK